MTTGAPAPEPAMAPGASAENPFAGQGSVLLDIGGDVGALVVAMPAALISTEVEIRAVGDTGASHHGDGGHAHAHSHEHSHEHTREHSHEHSHAPGESGHHYPHVAVVERTAADGSSVPSLVFPELTEGAYELYVKGSDVVDLTVEVVGGQVTQATWPS